MGLDFRNQKIVSNLPVFLVFLLLPLQMDYYRELLDSFSKILIQVKDFHFFQEFLGIKYYTSRIILIHPYKGKYFILHSILILFMVFQVIL